MKSIVRGVLGLAVVLAWWTFSQNNVSTQSVATAIPERVWGGGAGALTIEAETSSRAQMSVSFSRDGEDGYLESVEEIGAGSHRWTIDVPREVGGYVELGAVAPKPGDTLSIRVLADGRSVFEDSDRLEEALEPGYAFFLQAYFADYAKGELDSD